jgi:hypothetical protein
MMSSGFQIEMRLVMLEDQDQGPRQFLGVGGYSVSPKDIYDIDKHDAVRLRMAAVSSELLNRAYMALVDEKVELDDIHEETLSADQIVRMADLVRVGKYSTTALMRTHDDGKKELTFTMTPEGEVN